MITISDMEQRVKALSESVKSSADQHHMLVGQAREAEAILEFMKSKAAEVAADVSVAVADVAAVVESQE